MGQEMPRFEWVRVSLPKTIHEQQDLPEKLRGAGDLAGTYFNLTGIIIIQLFVRYFAASLSKADACT